MNDNCVSGNGERTQGENRPDWIYSVVAEIANNHFNININQIASKCISICECSERNILYYKYIKQGGIICESRNIYPKKWWHQLERVANIQYHVTYTYIKYIWNNMYGLYSCKALKIWIRKYSKIKIGMGCTIRCYYLLPHTKSLTNDTLRDNQEEPSPICSFFTVVKCVYLPRPY